VVRFAEEIVYPIRLPDWQIVQIEKYEPGEMLFVDIAEILEGRGGVPPVLFV
jgi:hypothetical protein